MNESHIGKPRPSKHPRIRRVLNLLLAGLAAVAPLVGSIWLLTVLYRVLLKVGDLMINGALFAAAKVGELTHIPQLEEINWQELEVDFPGANLFRFLLPVVLVYLVGLAVANRPGRRALHWLNDTIQHIPLVGFIYSALRQFVDAVRNLDGDRKFKSAAYVEYPSPGCRLLGFVTGNYDDPQTGKSVTSIFIPTSPNPMTGFVVIVDDEKVMDSEMTLEEATKMVLSAGIVTPEHFGRK